MSIKRKFIASCAVISCITGLTSQSTLAAPQITGISAAADNLTDGTELTIFGAEFGVKSPAKPLVWADFEESAEPSPLGIRTSWNSRNNSQVSTQIVARNSGQSLQWDAAASRQDALGVTDIKPNGTEADRLYMFTRKYYDFDISLDQGGAGFNLKSYRFWGDIDGGSNERNNIYWGYQGSEGNDSGRMTAEYTATGGAAWSGFPAQEKGRWLIHEILYESGSIDGVDGVFDLYQDGQVYRNDINWRMRTSDYPKKYEDFYWDQISNGTAPGPLYMYYDMIYLDTTHARVMICGQANWENCSIKQVQIPTSWSDNQVSVVFKLGEFSAGEEVFVYVIDEQGSVSNGFSILSEGSSAPQQSALPLPPSGLRATIE